MLKIPIFNQLLTRFTQLVPCKYSRAVLIGSCAFVVYRLVHWLRKTPRLPAKGKVVIVTGCDTPLGFGTGIVRKLHELGYVVFAGCLDAEKARETIYKEFENSPYFNILQLDVSKSEQVDYAVLVVQAWLDANPDFYLFGIVNNAGIFTYCPMEWHSAESFYRVFDVNTFGCYRVTRSFLPFLRKHGKGGRVVNMASIVVNMPGPFSVAYIASKWAVKGMTDSLYFELANFGIHVSCICPDFYKTNLLTDVDRNVAALSQEVERVPKDVFDAYGGSNFIASAHKRLSKNFLEFSHVDISPVVSCAIDAISSHNPKRSYYPIGLFGYIGSFVHAYGSDRMLKTFLSMLND